MRVPRDLQEFSLKVDRAVTDLTLALQRAPTVDELAAQASDVLEALHAYGAYRAAPLDAPRGNRDDDSGNHPRRQPGRRLTTSSSARRIARRWRARHAHQSSRAGGPAIALRRGPHPDGDRRADRRVADAGAPASSVKRLRGSRSARSRSPPPDRVERGSPRIPTTSAETWHHPQPEPAGANRSSTSAHPVLCDELLASPAVARPGEHQAVEQVVGGERQAVDRPWALGLAQAQHGRDPECKTRRSHPPCPGSAAGGPPSRTQTGTSSARNWSIAPKRRLGVAAPWSEAHGVRDENAWVEPVPLGRDGLTLGRMYKTGDKVTGPDSAGRQRHDRGDVPQHGGRDGDHRGSKRGGQ